MEKVTVVKTDDPKKSRFNLKVTGKVQKIVTIEPGSVYMEGKPGETLSSLIRITPSPSYPFLLLDVKKLNNTPVQVDLVKPTKENSSWQLDIKVVSDKNDSIYEVLEIKTDSKYMPVMVLRVSAVFHSSPKKEP